MPIRRRHRATPTDRVPGHPFRQPTDTDRHPIESSNQIVRPPLRPCRVPVADRVGAERDPRRSNRTRFRAGDQEPSIRESDHHASPTRHAIRHRRAVLTPAPIRRQSPRWDQPAAVANRLGSADPPIRCRPKNDLPIRRPRAPPRSRCVTSAGSAAWPADRGAYTQPAGHAFDRRAPRSARRGWRDRTQPCTLADRP